MTPLEIKQAIASESEQFALAVDAAFVDRRVPGCPDWTLRDLVWHLGRVQSFWASVIRTGADVQPQFEEATTGPDDAPELRAWMRASTKALLDALGEVPWETPAWTWWRDDRTVGAIGRHQVQEAAVHRWDAQAAGATPGALPETVATDGLEEFLGIARQLREPAPILFVATDSGLRIAAADGPTIVTVSATASDLVLLLHGRIGVDQVVVDGDQSALTPFLISIG